MQKNTAGKWTVFAFQDEGGANPGEPVTGDAANITANIRIDGGAANPVDDTNPTELEDGYYIFDTTAAEGNGDHLLLCPQSATANVNVIAVPGAVWTTPPNFNALGIAAGAVTVGTNNDKTGYTASTVSDKTGYALAAPGPTVAEFEARTLLAAEYAPAADTTALLARRSTVYADNSVWITNTGGTAGTTLWTHGTWDTPSSNWADAVALATQLSNQIKLKSYGPSGSTVPSLSGANLSNMSVDLNGFAAIAFATTVLTGTRLFNGIMLGTTVLGNKSQLMDIYFASVIEIASDGASYPPHMNNVAFSTLRFTDVADASLHHFHKCHARDGSASTVTYTDPSNASVYAEFPEWNGEMVIGSLPAVAHKIWISGFGKVTINDTCLGGTVYVGQGIEVVNNGAMTVEVWSADPTAVEIRTEMDTSSTQLATIGANVVTLAASVATGFAAVPLAVWNALTSALTAVGSIGKWILDNAGGAGSGLTEQQVRDAMKLAPTAGASAEGSIDDTLDEMAIAIGAISAGSGAGAFEVNVTIKNSSSVIITDCDVILTTDATSPRIGVYATGVTNASGIVTFYVDEGVLYVWRQKGGVNFDDNPLTMTIDSLGGVVIT